MGRNNGHGKLSKKIEKFPQILIDKENDFASIKIAKGIEFKSYEKEGFIFCEDKSGRVIVLSGLDRHSWLDNLSQKSVRLSV